MRLGGFEPTTGAVPDDLSAEIETAFANVSGVIKHAQALNVSGRRMHDLAIADFPLAQGRLVQRLERWAGELHGAHRRSGYRAGGGI